MVKVSIVLYGNGGWDTAKRAESNRAHTLITFKASRYYDKAEGLISFMSAVPLEEVPLLLAKVSAVPQVDSSPTATKNLMLKALQDRLEVGV